MIVTAKINTSSPAGLKLVKEIEKHNKVASVEYPLPIGFNPNNTHQEVFDRVWDDLSEHYGIDMRKL